MICNFKFDGGGPKGLNAPPPSVPCGGGQFSGPPPGAVIQTPRGTITVPAHQSQAQIRAFAVAVANQDYRDYSTNFLVPSYALMIETGLWISLVAIAGFVVGLGLSSLIGQRTVPVVILIVWGVILSPPLSQHLISHLLNVQRGILYLALGHIEPGGLPLPFGPGGGGGGGQTGHALLPESTLVASLVIVGWLVVWTALGAWRMATRDA